MQKTARRIMLKKRPSAIFRLQTLTQHWVEEVDLVLNYRSNVSALVNKLYARVPEEARSELAGFIADSKYHHVVKLCDNVYLKEWLKQRFLQVVRSIEVGHHPEQPEALRRTATSTLATWLRRSPQLRENFAAVVGECFYATVPRVWHAAKLEMVLDTVVPRQFRTPHFFEKILRQAPHLTAVAAQHVQEDRHLMQLSRTQCRYVAALPGGWFSLYPKSERGEQINGLFEMMGTLDHYDPDMMRVALKMQDHALAVQTELPTGFDVAPPLAPPML